MMDGQEEGCGEKPPQVSGWRREDAFAANQRVREAQRGAALPGGLGCGSPPFRPTPSPNIAAPLRAGRAPSGGGAARARPEPEPDPGAGAERSGAGAERAERAEPAAELGARAGGMYRARAARAGPEPGSPGRFGILSTGQLRDLLQDEPKLDRIVRLSRKVARGSRVGGAGMGRGLPDLPSNRRAARAGPRGRRWAREPGTYEWAPRSRPRGRGRPEPAWGGWDARDPGWRPCTPGMAARRVLQRMLRGGVFWGAGVAVLWGALARTPTFCRARKGRRLP